MTTKIAPTLSALLGDVERDPEFFGGDDSSADAKAARAELRALLAVAEATREETASDRGCQAKPLRDRCPMCRALARLSRVSGGRRNRAVEGNRKLPANSGRPSRSSRGER